MNDIKKKDFLNEKTLKICYIYGVELNDDETLKKVFYYRHDEKGELIDRNWDVKSVANKIINGEWLAYAGKIEGKENPVMKNPSLVTVKTIDDVLYLTTASDDEKSNNLINLPKYKTK